MEIIVILGILILIFYMVFILFRTTKHLNPLFFNPIVLIIIVIVILLVTFHNQVIGIIMLIAFGLILYLNRRQYEGFRIVEDDNVQKIVEFEDDSLLSTLQNDEEAVVGVWACSTLGKEMGLNKG